MAAGRTLTNRTGGSRSARRPLPHLVRLLSYERPLASSALHVLADVDEVHIGRGDETTVARSKGALTLAIDDARMSSKHARLHHHAGSWIVEDLGSRNGTFVDGVRKDSATLADGALLELGRTTWLFRVMPAGTQRDVDADELVARLPRLTTFSPMFASSLEAARKIAASQQTVLLHGETGSGKELVAHGIHTASKRTGPFVAVNCGALPETLVESELFGAKKGAFSGATEDRVGLIRSADGGTLFLDEIGDLAAPAQAALLRVLQEHEVLAVGATRPVRVDVRVIAATHRDLEADVTAQRFREDLLARIAGFVVEIPPLAARREDLGLLVRALLARHGASSTFAPDAARALLRYSWPRNVRELEQALASAIALAEGGAIELEHLPPALRAPAAKPAERAPADERETALRTLLARHKGNVAAVARAMGVARMQVHRWLERYAIDVDAFR
jgi:transcriptional regulator with PAS, ATPase and Fis domain